MLKVMKMFASLLYYKLLGIVVRGNDTCFPWKQKKKKKKKQKGNENFYLFVYFISGSQSFTFTQKIRS